MRDLIKKDGFIFAFDPQACFSCNGACCRGESGVVWLKKKDVENIAKYLGITEKSFLQEYCKKERYSYTLKELKRKGEYFCVFFEEGKGCQIYPARPKQCKDYPFWERYKDKNYIDEVCKECKGILLP